MSRIAYINLLAKIHNQSKNREKISLQYKTINKHLTKKIAQNTKNFHLPYLASN